jgi:hypothetical protein
MIQVPLADDEGRNQFRVRVQRDECPDIAVCASLFCIVAFRADKSPNLVHFNLLARQAAHFFVHNALAGLTNPQCQPANGFLLDAGDAFNRTDACAFAEHRNRGRFFFGFKYVCHIVYLS